ncbi:MAG: site-specific DNA-methyltransferase [Pseudomonas sp.]|nr:site-specific DNA-methyltransferase [Pseudomonas sp.]MBB51843.1 site-specific DNA-methyltransferase [Pseudomonadales bacterium]MBB52334.1 site-specific DNA-methyltransferase [Pseudomonadales bacterium]|tara:strand:- start:28926 stop:30554 length:1629 start_codon:yes stop_codon:yes gene_type:complete
MRKTKLELTWIGKDKRPKLEPRILLENPELSYHASHKVSENDIFDNKLIFGDNLLALKALEQEYTGKVKCVFIDPPYNTGNAFEHYDDGIEHSLWLSLIRERLVILRNLLADNGSIWITIDNNEAHYLKVVCDEIFMRKNFVSDISWHKRVSPANDAKYFSADHDHILVYAKNKEFFKPNRLKNSESQLKNFKNVDNDPRGPWNSSAYTCAKNADERPNLYYPIKNPNTGEEIWPKRTRVWAYGEETHLDNERNGLVYWGKDGKGSMPRIKKFLSNSKGVVPRSLWTYDETGHNQESNLEMLELFPDNPFSTPKPEKLIKRVLEIATEPKDLVLDSFAGSGTTGAVAQKMLRKWIMIELEDTCHTHVRPRLKKVIDGEDQGGISKSVNWQGGGGFRYYKLAPSLIEYDRFGQPVINKEFNAEMLAEAVCKLEGFTYAPSETLWWQHGYSTETDFIYVTTQNLSIEQLEQISEEVGSDKTLLVMCGAFRCKADRFANLTIKKMPKAVLQHCEWAHDDYSLNVQNLPMAQKENEQQDPQQDDLF